MALVLVVGSMLILAMFAMTALAYTLQSQRFARYSQDFSGAMAAAQSGIEDYVGHLNRDDVYGATPDCTNVALQGPTTTSNTCTPAWNGDTPVGWLPVQAGETDPKAAWFHYSVDASGMSSLGSIVVKSTGRVNGEYRTIEAVVGKGSSTDYVYYTNFESADPDNVQAYPPSGTTSVDCGQNGADNAKYWYNGRDGSHCNEITFISDDTLNGPVFSNDAVDSDGATFSDGFTSANPECSRVTASSGTWNNCLRQHVTPAATANFTLIQPKLAEHPFYLTDTSGAFATNPGCHYYGSTRVIFNSNGTMTVWNKTVNNGNKEPFPIAAPGRPAPLCGDVAALNVGQTLPVPNEMVIYAAAAPTAPEPGGVVAVRRQQCNSNEIGGPLGRTLPFGTYDRTLVPTTFNSHTNFAYDYDSNMVETTKFCAEGNLYAEGTVKGRVTLAAAQSVIATGDLVLAGGRNGYDMLGLVATNSVEVYHPRDQKYSVQKLNANCQTSGTTYRICPSGSASEVSGWPTRYADPTTGSPNPAHGIQIAGSIQALDHSFLVQKYDQGPSAGTLDVFGSIAQRWRGIVGTSGSSDTGYYKLYEYDRRLTYARPPYFLAWINSQWSEHYSGEINTPGTVKSS